MGRRPHPLRKQALYIDGSNSIALFASETASAHTKKMQKRKPIYQIQSNSRDLINFPLLGFSQQPNKHQRKRGKDDLKSKRLLYADHAQANIKINSLRCTIYRIEAKFVHKFLHTECTQLAGNYNRIIQCTYRVKEGRNN